MVASLYPGPLTQTSIAPKHPNTSMPSSRRHLAAVLAFAGFCTAPAVAQKPETDAIQVINAAVESQLEADRVDHSNWIYRERNPSPGHDAIYNCVGSPEGEVRRLIELNGNPPDAATAEAEADRITQYVNSPAEQAASRKNGAHDDVQATELLKMLPRAFLWTITSETPELITLDYRPNPKFDGPDMQSRVMSTMAGQMVIARNGNHYRIRTFRGALVSDFKIGYGLLGRLYKGGTFDIERREVGPGYWEITETHVHIAGHALIFKTIGTQEDEVKYDWKPSPAGNLREAAHILGVR
jgi:hypothetical protein